MKKALTIAGSDSGGGAGIQADLKTFAALGVWGTSAIVAVTAQNTREVTAVHTIPDRMISSQIHAVFSDIGAESVKIGMLANSAIIRTVAGNLKGYKGHIVLDPVMVAASGAKLLDDSAVRTLTQVLFPMAEIVTPNIPEAEVLSGMKIANERSMEIAAAKILAFGCKAVLLKGGHLPKVVDILVTEGKKVSFHHKRLPKEGHGTGCTLSSAIAAYLARGDPLDRAVKKSINYVYHSLAAGMKVGKKNYVLNHFWKWS